MLFNFSLVLSSSAEILSSGLITSSSVTKSSFHITKLYVHMQKNKLAFTPKGKPILANKGTKSLNLYHPLLDLVITLSNVLILAPIVSPR